MYETNQIKITTMFMFHVEKTHLLVMGTKRQAEARKLVRIDTGKVVISPVETEKLLGITHTPVSEMA